MNSFGLDSNPVQTEPHIQEKEIVVFHIDFNKMGKYMLIFFMRQSHMLYCKVMKIPNH